MMDVFLKRLEIRGFKSFADKTVLEFPKRMVAVVGPNGCGKSNIVDAFCFLLGEREASYLRQDSLVGLIFSGSKTKPALSLASVSFLLDNSSGFLPTEATEVKIKRKIDRSGNSEIFINDKPILLKDLRGILAKARVSSRGLVIVRQGEADIFIKKSFVERKALLEDFIGLREFILKKEQSERQLKATKENLEKVELTIKELEPRLRLLKRQVSRYEKKSEYESELSALENTFFAFKLKETQKHREQKIDLEKIKEELAIRRERIKTLVFEREKMEEKIFSSEEIKKIRGKIDGLFEEKIQIEKKLSWLEAKLEGKRETFPEAGTLLKKIKPRLEKCLSLEKVETIKQEIKEIIGLLENRPAILDEKAEREKKDIAKNLNEINNKISSFQQKEKEISQRNNSLNQDFKNILSETEKIREEINILENKKNRALLEKEKTNLKLEELEEEMKRSDKSFNGIKNVQIPPDFNFQETERKIIRLKNLLFGIGEVDQTLVSEKQEVEERYNDLNSQLEDLKNASSDLENLIGSLTEKINTEFREKLNLINKEFDKYFKILFKGGQAKLKLKQVDDREGIEIDLSFSSKKKTSLETLSGGEKTLVSLALLFGLVSISPPPFLVLDEVDAALDEKNALKFAQLLKSLSFKTQFIIITHNRASMEMADALYGITMGSDGVSKVYSLKLSEAEKKADVDKQ